MKSITKSQYYTLIGLKEAATKYYLIINELEKLALEITGEERDYGHTTDYLACSRELDDMLGILEIEVKE